MADTAFSRLVLTLEQHCRRVRGSGDRRMAQCPGPNHSHDDRNPSLSIKRIEGQTLLYCFAGCATEDVLAALNLSLADLFDDPRGTDYRYDDGRIVHRFPTLDKDKKFRQSGNTKGTALYRLTAVREAVAAGKPVAVVEGEKDCAALESLGVTATCSAMGAGKAHLADWSPLTKADVLIVADQDKPGRKHAQQVHQILTGLGARALIVAPKTGKDAADHIAAGHGIGDFVPIEDAAEWPDPVPLDPPRTPATFPVNALPDWNGNYATALAEATQTPPDLPGCCVLGVLAACAGGRAVIQARPGWREPLNLYVLPVLPPGSRKSAVVAAATRPLYAVEKELAKDASATISETTTFKEIAQRAAEKALRKAANADDKKTREDLTSEAVSLVSQAEAIEIPKIPRLIADDVTPEAAASLLAEHGGRLAIISAEGGVFDVMAGKYSKGVPALDTWLKGHAGDTLRVDRKGRPAEYIEHPALTLMLTVQPIVLSVIARHGVFKGRGLLARFLYSIPENNIGHRQVGTAPVPDAVTALYEEEVRKLAKELADWTDPAVLRLAPDAHELLLDIERTIEPRLADDGDLGSAGLADWGSKLAGAILRIAGLLHLASAAEAFRTDISRTTLQNAARIGTYFAEHAQAAFGLLGDRGTSDAAYVLEHLRRTGTEEFTIRSLHVELPRGRFAIAEDVVAAVEILEEHGYVHPQPQPEHKGPGRRPSPAYRLHPQVHES